MKIWCVEDDESVREIELYTLTSVGYEARGFSEGKEFFEALRLETPDLILLDIMLPNEDGVGLLKKLKGSMRTASIPVIMATAKGAEYDKIESLDLGADDYMVKPFGMMEMISRIKAVLRRCRCQKEKLLRRGALVMDIEKRKVTVDDQVLELTYKEFELLKLLMEAPGHVFTREAILEAVWEEEVFTETRTVDVHIRSLRKKLGPYGTIIETVRHVGYKMEE